MNREHISNVLQFKPSGFDPLVEQHREDEDGELHYQEWKKLAEQEHIDERSVLPNEIVIDIDEGDTEERRQKTEQVCTLLNEFPLFVADSGGTGFHIHLFFGVPDNVDEAHDVRSYRLALFEWIKDKIDDEATFPSDDLDEQPVDFDTETSKGHLIRAVGGRHPDTGHRKTKVRPSGLDKNEVEDADEVEFPVLDNNTDFLRMSKLDTKNADLSWSEVQEVAEERQEEAEERRQRQLETSYEPADDGLQALRELPADEVLKLLGRDVPRGTKIQCPCHDDNEPSAKVTDGTESKTTDPGALLCFSGCVEEDDGAAHHHNAIDIMMENGHDFQEARDKLADEFNVDLEDNKSTTPSMDDLKDMMQEAEEADGFERSNKRRKVFEAVAHCKGDKQRAVLNEYHKQEDVAKKDLEESLDAAVDELVTLVEGRKALKRQNMKAEDTQTNADVSDSGITDELAVHDAGEVIYLNPRPPAVVKEHSKTEYDTNVNDVGTIDKEAKFRAYKVQFGHGQDEGRSTLLVDPDRIISKGERKLPIKKADLTKPVYYNSDHFLDEYEKYAAGEDEPMPYNAFLNRLENELQVLELQDRVDVRSKEVIEDLDNDTILSLIQEYLRDEYRTDPKLRTVMYPKIVQHDKSQVRPDNVAMYAPHTQMWTNTKVGKSHTSDRIGRRYEDATPAGLLGYADTDGKQLGMIDGLDTGVFIDEFDFGSSSEQLNDHLLSLMEQGRFEQVKAGHSIKTRFYGSMTYMANPKESNMPVNNDTGVTGYTQGRSKFELVSKFEQLIQVLGMNIQAMASRFGVIVFDDDMQTAEPMDDADLPDERFRKLEAFVEWASREIASEYTDIEAQLEDWLEQEYEDDYCSRVEDLAEEVANEKVEKFWKNHLHSYRHARGQALRMAVYQYAGDVVKHDYSIDDIRSEADKQWEQVKDINMDSLENMTKATDSDMMADRARSKADGCDPKYLRLFIKSVIRHHQLADREKIGTLHTFDALKDVFEDIRDGLPDGDVNSDSRYWKWSRVRSRMSGNINRKRLEVEQEFGVELLNRDGQNMFRVKVPERFRPFLELEIGDTGDTDDDGDSGDTGDGDSGDTGDGDSGDTPDIGFNESDDIKIDGSYKPTRSGVKQLIGDNLDNYENGVPEEHLTRYFGRRFEGSKHEELQTHLKNLKSEGALNEYGDGLKKGMNW